MKHNMLVAVFLIVLGVSWAASEPIPVQPMMPANPKYSFEEWQNIFKNQALLPEVCQGCNNGTEPQPELSGKIASGHDSRIIGGSIATSGQFPWQVQIRMDQQFFCGGSIIGDQWILSAGHCAYGFSTFIITLGSLVSQTYDPNKITITSRNGIPHENYNPSLISDDISVIKLSTRIASWNNNVRPIRLPSNGESQLSFYDEPAVLSGWGRYGTSSVSPSISNELRFVNLTVIDNIECSITYGSTIRLTNICTRGVSQRGGPVGACNGDSGGALVRNKNDTYSQIGIVSFGIKDGCIMKFPSAFTRVTSYLKWISSKTGIAIQP